MTIAHEKGHRNITKAIKGLPFVGTLLFYLYSLPNLRINSGVSIRLFGREFSISIGVPGLTVIAFFITGYLISSEVAFFVFIFLLLMLWILLFDELYAHIYSVIVEDFTLSTFIIVPLFGSVFVILSYILFAVLYRLIGITI